jgi:hypothetical protein
LGKGAGAPFILIRGKCHENMALLIFASYLYEELMRAREKQRNEIKETTGMREKR